MWTDLKIRKALNEWAAHWKDIKDEWNGKLGGSELTCAAQTKSSAAQSELDKRMEYAAL